MLSLRRFRAVVRKEGHQLLRDPRTLGMTIFMPVVQLILYGYLSFDALHLRTVVWDQSNTIESREFLDALEGTQYFRIIAAVGSEADIRHRLDASRARVGVVIEPDYADRLHTGRGATVQLLVDGSEPTVARAALAAGAQLGQVISVQLQQRTLRAAGLSGSHPPLEVRTRAWYNPELADDFFMIPGLLGVILTLLTTSLTAVAIVRERERGTLEQLVSTPVTRVELVLGKLVPYGGVGLTGMTVALILSHFLFQVPIRGSLFLLYALSMVLLFSTLSMGALISAVSRTGLQAMQMSFFIVMPSILLSGYIFPRETLPWFLWFLGALLPLTHYIAITRGIMLKGVGFASLWSQAAWLLAIGVAVAWLAVLLSPRRLD